VWNAGLTKEPTTKNYKGKKCIRLAAGRKVCEDGTRENKGTKKGGIPLGEGDTGYIYLDSFASTGSRHHAWSSLGATPFPWVSRLVGPQGD